MNNRQNYTIKVSNIDYSGNDFCGEISSKEASKIIDEQPKEFFITFDAEQSEIDIDYIKDVVSEYIYDNGILDPTSFDYEII